MTDGIQVTVEFPAPAACPYVVLSRTSDVVIMETSTNTCPDGSGSVTDFMVESKVSPAIDGFECVISFGERHLLRYAHDEDSCPCERLGQLGYPIQRYSVQAGMLRLVIHAAGFDEFRTIVDELSEEFPEIEVVRLVRSPDPDAAPDVVHVDRGKMTKRQLESLELAYRMGYFDWTRGCTGEEVAAKLDISPSTFHQHLRVAQQKVLADVLEIEQPAKLDVAQS